MGNKNENIHWFMIKKQYAKLDAKQNTNPTSPEASEKPSNENEYQSVPEEVAEKLARQHINLNVPEVAEQSPIETQDFSAMINEILFHSVHIAFDHEHGTLFISVIQKLSGDLEKDYFQALEKVQEIHSLLKAPVKHSKSLSASFGHFNEEMGDKEFCERVKKAQDYIRQGEAFQIVLSRTFSTPFKGEPFDIYRALRMTNPSPFMFYMQTKDFAIAGSSPERLVKVQEEKLSIMPIAGTRSRNSQGDETLIQELLENEKEDAEHMMLVDLSRNDLGVVAEVGTVHVKELKTARVFSHVIHLVSLIEAKLAKGLDAFDALKAVFPAGTLSGAPKIRAIQIIDELEESRRGLYGGAIYTIDNQGNLDSCIVIRTAFIKDDLVSIRAGAGIVLDSDPQKEADETRAKAKGVIDAVHLATSGVL